ncbi:hypothetical protein [Mycolicibacter longobardus]|uniref:DUF7159 domain-containing protein n=1 Tax=Mycolicibacter longobardus TaxID=1108812 RepID=A0A1X1YF49_9MYCO|nr:hypothetical protein [Mycolicibacter longobardus]ORW09683.1 hypothetical protein AWC16_15875 [Mycolicibacter longobardus]
MDVVLGVALASSTPATIHTVLVCGEYGDGVTLEELSFDVPTDDATDFAAVDAVIAAILRARDAADSAGHQLVSTGVTVTDPLDADALSSRLSTGGLEGLGNVALISPVLAAASLARNLGQTVGCDRMGLLSVESATATLAMVDCTDGSVTRIFRQPLDNGDARAAVDTVADRLSTHETSPDGLFLLCSGGDSTAIRPRLEATVNHEVCEPTEPLAALARGAALASARLACAGEESAVIGASTAALAYTQEPASGALTPGYYDIPDSEAGLEADGLAYSAVPDEDAAAATEFIGIAGQPARRPLLVAGATLASAAFAAASALMVAMALDITPNLVALRPDIGRVLTIPHRTPNLQVPTAESFGGQPPVTGHAPMDLLPLPPLSHPPAPELPAPVLDLPAPALDLPAPAAVPVAAGPGITPLFIPAPVFGPPLHAETPAAHGPSPFVLAPVIHQPTHHRPVLSGLADLSFLLGLPAKKPTPPSSAPKSPVEVPTPPVVKPVPPIELPEPPVVKPNPPVVKPKPPIELPEPPVVKPNPPVVKPNPPVVKPNPPVVKPNPPIQVPEPPVVNPNPPIHLPEPPVINPNPPIHVPDMPVKLPDPPVANPSPPLQLPELGIQPPNAAPPIGLPAVPAPNAPTFPGLPAIPAPNAPAMPAPSAPAIPAAPSMPAFNPPALPNFPAPSAPAPALPAPKAPSMPAFPAPQAPSLPSLPAPKAPSMPVFPAPKAPSMPSMPSMPAPSGPSLPNLGGGIGGGGKPGGGIFGGGGGKPGGGIFGGGGGKPGGGIFGGGGGGGIFGGGGGKLGGGIFGGGGGRGGGLFGH